MRRDALIRQNQIKPSSARHQVTGLVAPSAEALALQARARGMQVAHPIICMLSLSRRGSGTEHWHPFTAPALLARSFGDARYFHMRGVRGLTRLPSKEHLI